MAGLPAAGPGPAAPFLHCWQADLGTADPGWPLAEAALSPAERARQARLRTPALRQTYGRAHGFLRAVLSGYAGQPAAALRFGTEEHGKPILLASSLFFNFSYRAGRALLAIASHRPVGADVEPLQPLADAQALVKELFSTPEQAALHAATPAAWWPLFYRIWTRKEAYAKALGMGLSMPFAAFSVLELAGAGQVRPVQPTGARLHSFGCGAGHVGAVAVLAAGPVPQQFTYRPAGPLAGARAY